MFFDFNNMTRLIRTPQALDRAEIALLYLSPPQRPLCVVGRLGERKRERAGHDGKGEERTEAPAVSLFPSSPARFPVFRLFYFDGDIQREPPRRRELLFGLFNENKG